MTIVDNEKNGPTKWFKCAWCPNLFLTQSDLDRHLEAFRTTGVKPNEYDHKVKWNGLLHYRDKVEPYEKNIDSW
jgi:hypothetical protein